MVGGIVLVQEVHNNNIMFLAVTVATTNSLFNALWIPRKVIVNDHGTELQVDPLGGGFGGDHDFGTVTKVVHQRGSNIGGS